MTNEVEVLNFKEIINSNYLYLLVNKNFLNKMIKFFGYKDYVLNILLVGGGNIGHKLSQLIENDEQEINLKLLEKNIDKCNFLATSLNKTSVFCGDALDQSLYEEINLSKSDLVITVTDNDQINTILSIIAKKRGAKSVISVINNDSYSSFANDLGIDIMINPRELTTSRIIEKISEGSLLSYHSILRDKYFIYEVKYKNELYEQIKKSKDIAHICSISDNSIILATDDHIPVNNDVLILLIQNIHAKSLEKIINDY